MWANTKYHHVQFNFLNDIKKNFKQIIPSRSVYFSKSFPWIYFYK